jgi:hypothetical protein
MLKRIRNANLVEATGSDELRWSIDEIEAYAKTHLAIPDDEDDLFCTSYECELRPEQKFRLFLTTKRLLGITLRVNYNFISFCYSNKIIFKYYLKSNHIDADATYNLIEEKFPVLTVGTTDQDLHFHPFGMGISNHEEGEDFCFMFRALQDACKRIYGFDYEPKVLCADNATQISNGFIMCFGEPEKVNYLFSELC